MQQYISIILLIAPGFMMRKLMSYWSNVEREKSDFEKTVNSLINSIPIFIVNYIILCYYCKISTIQELVLNFNYLAFILKYTLLTLGVTLFTSLVLSFLRVKYKVKLINKIRKLNKLDLQGCHTNTFLEFVADSSKNKALAIYKDGKLISRGFLNKWNNDVDIDKEIILEFEDIFENNEECFDVIDRQYYNFDKNILIKEYNLEKLYSKLK